MDQDQVVARLRELSDSIIQTDDYERDHSKADDALIGAIQILAYIRTEEIKRECARLIQMHRGLHKWYA